MIKFKYSKNIFQDAGIEIGKQIIEKLKMGKVALFLSGGSALNIYPVITEVIKNDTNLKNLTIGMVDERHFPHNPLNLDELNALKIKNNVIYDVLSTKVAAFKLVAGSHLDDIVTEYENFLEKIFDGDYYKIGILGISTDGHTAGMLPIFAELEFGKKFLGADLFTVYKATDYPYRLTMTMTALLKLNKVYIALEGKEKSLLIPKLKEKQKTGYADFPAGVFKQLDTEIFFDVEVK